TSTVAGGDTADHLGGAIQVRQVTGHEEGAPGRAGLVDLVRDPGARAGGQVDEGNPAALGRERGCHRRPEPAGRPGDDDRSPGEPHPASSIRRPVPTYGLAAGYGPPGASPCSPRRAPVKMRSDCLQSCQRSAGRSRMPGYQNEQPHSDTATSWPSGRPPFRADHVGSLLRPPEVLRAREDLAADRPADMAITTHMCRGNNQSMWAAEGGYEVVADALFNELRVDGFFCEWDDERSGGFEPLRFVPKCKRVVLGLVTPHRGELDSKDPLKRRYQRG